MYLPSLVTPQELDTPGMNDLLPAGAAGLSTASPIAVKLLAPPQYIDASARDAKPSSSAAASNIPTSTVEIDPCRARHGRPITSSCAAVLTPFPLSFSPRPSG